MLKVSTGICLCNSSIMLVRLNTTKSCSPHTPFRSSMSLFLRNLETLDLSTAVSAKVSVGGGEQEEEARSASVTWGRNR